MDFITLIFVEKIKFINVKHNIQVLLIETSKLPYNLCMNSMMLEKVKNSDRVGTYMRLLPIFYLLCFLEYPVSVNCKSTKTMRASDIASYQYSPVQVSSCCTSSKLSLALPYYRHQASASSRHLVLYCLNFYSFL
jgi:hypothetical protein